MIGKSVVHSYNTQTLNMRSIGDYIAGYVDGEGCFSVSFSKRAKLTLGWETKPSFSVSQNHYRSEVLYVIQKTLQCGNMRRDFSDQTLKFEVRKSDDLIHKVIPFFDVHPLLSGKQSDFELFKQICVRVYEGKHLQKKGLREIVKLGFKMNPSGRRRYSEDDILATIR
jgi:hypothetical protein